jgi:DNA invertase Pin-like site-specific DNA recombinase
MAAAPSKVVRCAIYTRVSTDAGLDQEFNSLDAQFDAAQAYIRSQAHAGWSMVRTRYDDGGFSGGSTDRPALQQLLADIRDGKVNVIVVYKVDRLTRSLADFAKLVELFDSHGVSFVSVTQQFNTTTSMGRLTLNVLLSFAQFEREVTFEIRDERIKLLRFAEPEPSRTIGLAWRRTSPRKADFIVLGQIVVEALNVPMRQRAPEMGRSRSQPVLHCARRTPASSSVR